MRKIDLNADVGEGQAAEGPLMKVITSASIACGGHTGDLQSMTRTLLAARDHGVRVGAHPSYPDRESFGRKSMQIETSRLAASLRDQVNTLIGLASEAKVSVAYIKPHGALYSDVATKTHVASAVAAVAREFGLPLMLLAGIDRPSELKGIDVIEEGFIDRRYDDAGLLADRTLEGAVITNAEPAKEQALRLAPVVDSLCVHSDTPGAELIALAAREALQEAGYTVTS